MVVVGGADEPVVGDVHELPQVQHAPGAGDDAVHKFLGGDPGLLGLVLDLLAVLVGAGEEEHVAALKPLIAGHGVGGHGAVGMADVELVRGVVDGGGNVKFLLLISFHVSDLHARRGAFVFSSDDLGNPYPSFGPSTGPQPGQPWQEPPQLGGSTGSGFASLSSSTEAMDSR